MTTSVSITDAQVFQALGDFLLGIVLPNTEVTQGQLNRVAEPSVPDFVVMWPLFRKRLATNVDSYSDVAFVGSISVATLTVSRILNGTIVDGLSLSGVGVAANTTILSQISGDPGGVGVYQISPSSQTVVSTTIQAGSKLAMKATEVTIQLDVHGPNSSENGQIITTLFRDGYGADSFAASGFDIQPLYANDARQIPFLNAEQQYEKRWSIDVVLQANPVVSVAQQFASQVKVGLNDADLLPPGEGQGIGEFTIGVSEIS